MQDKSPDIALVSLPLNGQKSQPFLTATLCDLEKIHFEHGPEAHRHDFYSIFWVKKGKLLHTVDDHTYQVDGNALFLLAPGQVHRISFAGRPEGYFIGFSDHFLCLKDPGIGQDINSSLFFNSESNSLIRVEDSQMAGLEQVVQLLLFESASPKDHQQEASQHLLRYLLVLVSRMAGNRPEPGHPLAASHSQSLFLAFKRLMDEHFASHKKVADYALILHITSERLSEICRQVGRATPGEMIRERLVTEAKRYLHHTDFPSKQIAYKLGFDDPHYFSRFFKNQAGQSPQEFKFLNRRESSRIN